MPNGGSDCCGTCWFGISVANSAAGTLTTESRAIAKSVVWTFRTGSGPTVQTTPTTVRVETSARLAPVPAGDSVQTTPTTVRVETPSRSDRYAIDDALRSTRKEWQPSPDTEGIREHLLDIVRVPDEHRDTGYHFFTHPAHIAAIEQLLEWRDPRLISALEEIAQNPAMERARADIEETIQLVRERLDI